MYVNVAHMTTAELLALLPDEGEADRLAEEMDAAVQHLLHLPGELRGTRLWQAASDRVTAASARIREAAEQAIRDGTADLGRQPHRISLSSLEEKLDLIEPYEAAEIRAEMTTSRTVGVRAFAAALEQLDAALARLKATAS